MALPRQLSGPWTRGPVDKPPTAPGRRMEKSIEIHRRYGGLVMGVPQKRWFIMENRINMDDNWGYPISGSVHMCVHTSIHCVYMIIFVYFCTFHNVYVLIALYVYA